MGKSIVSARRSATTRGRVQGVGFRWSAKREAALLGVAGFVTNRRDGTVYVEVEGQPDAVERFTDWLRTGPPGAVVESVHIEELEPLGDGRFEIRE